MRDCGACGHAYGVHGSDGKGRCRFVVNPQAHLDNMHAYELCPCGTYVEDEA